jgi:hypothetical protein
MAGVCENAPAGQQKGRPPMKNSNGKSNLTLSLQDVYQDGLQDRVDITLKHTVLSDTRTIKNQVASTISRFFLRAIGP